MPPSGSHGRSFFHCDACALSSTGRRYGARSAFRLASYVNGNVSAYSSMKKSNGLITIMSATTPTVILR